MTLNVALLGYGYAGKTFHAPLIAATPGLRLAAVASSDPAKVRADLPDATVLPDAAAVLAQADLDLVVIATPNDTHADLARRALEAGRHVVVDKPFTLTLAEARELADLAASAGRVLSVFHNRRWDADFLTLRRLVADGTLGEVLALESRFDRFRPEVRKRWREAAIPGGGLWYDLGPHLVDQALRLFGPPDAVYADLALQRPGAEAVDYCHVLLRYPRRRVVLHASMLVAGDSPRFAAHGLRGQLPQARPRPPGGRPQARRPPRRPRLGPRPAPRPARHHRPGRHADHRPRPGRARRLPGLLRRRPRRDPRPRAQPGPAGGGGGGDGGAGAGAGECQAGEGAGVRGARRGMTRPQRRLTAACGSRPGRSPSPDGTRSRCPASGSGSRAL